MRKISIRFDGEVTICLNDDEDIDDVIRELEISHPDNTRVIDYEIKDMETIDSY